MPIAGPRESYGNRGRQTVSSSIFPFPSYPPLRKVTPEAGVHLGFAVSEEPAQELA